MRLTCLLFVLSTILHVVVDAQTIITIDEAINMANQNNIELFKQSTKVKKAKSKLNESTRLPNPSLSYSREDMSDNQHNFNEWSVVGSIPINFLWERWKNINSKESLLDAQELLYENQKNLVISNVQQNYISHYYYSELYKLIHRVQTKIKELVQSANHRFDKGDISEYELQRIIIELNKVNSELADVEIKKTNLENNLKLLIGFETQNTIKTVMPNSISSISKNEKELLELAIENRLDLKAFQLLVKSEESNLSFQKSRSLPNVNLAAGYKRQSDNFEGSVIELELELPLFERNQTQINGSEIELSVLRKEIIFLRENIKREVLESYKNYTLNKSLFENVSRQNFDNLFESAAISYEYGESSIVEFLDGINAYIDGVTLIKKTAINFNNSYFKLEIAIGIRLSNIEEN